MAGESTRHGLVVEWSPGYEWQPLNPGLRDTPNLVNGGSESQQPTSFGGYWACICFTVALF
jgi:hypothetical protein